MKLFFKKHSLLVAVQVVQLLMVLSILWLDGDCDIQLFLYNAFLNLLMLACYLIYYFLSRKKFYERLSMPLESLDNSIQQTEAAPIPKL
ncbi:hypothetical protein GW534_08880 [Bacillus sp. P1(2020)]|uniref:Uncharacterized protein n=1 Tax=Pallidibacillus pasinlerensis TaxID=2703818 RepID=A0ABX0A5R2_9BACI|nr:hypothetical protein [Pallidibacillus pasinlerensis]